MEEEKSNYRSLRDAVENRTAHFKHGNTQHTHTQKSILIIIIINGENQRGEEELHRYMEFN